MANRKYKKLEGVKCKYDDCGKEDLWPHDYLKTDRPRFICHSCHRKQRLPKGKKVELKLEDEKLIAPKTNVKYSDRGYPQAEGYAHDLPEFLEKLNFDDSMWEVASWDAEETTWDIFYAPRDQQLKWDVHETKEGGYQQFMSGYSNRSPHRKHTSFGFKFKVKFQPKKGVIVQDKFKEELVQSIGRTGLYVPHRHVGMDRKALQHMMEVNFMDLHLDAIAFAIQSGYDWNVEEARKTLFGAVEYFIELAQMFGIEEIWFPYGNDWFNSDKDTPVAQTTSGTLMRNDLRWQEMFRQGRDMLIDIIERLSQIAPVKCFLVPGNHDNQKSFYLGDVLEMRFRNDENVTVDNREVSRKYNVYGQSLIGYEHGRVGNLPLQRLLHLMPQEVPHEWAATKYHEWHLGDIHHGKKVTQLASEDMNGIEVRWMRNLRPPDLYEFDHGYFKMGGAETMIWHREKGRVTEFRYNL